MLNVLRIQFSSIFVTYPMSVELQGKDDMESVDRNEELSQYFRYPRSALGVDSIRMSSDWSAIVNSILHLSDGGCCGEKDMRARRGYTSGYNPRNNMLQVVKANKLEKIERRTFI